MSAKTIFERIIEREIPADIVHEDDRCIAIRDINPQAPNHLLVIPKRRIVAVSDLQPADAELAGHLLVVAARLAQQLGLENGYRIVINCGTDGGQSVDHLHVHVLGGRRLAWPPG